ncbi:unnamed protein product [Callosobruchus maculatus]|uniref:Uncharacterized protein n=1 Tax=Callosobruchus maculatus TaxID=64391 RepID=A0A653DME8_CALMS|nr:unnamed protein product [Callosobruchus maculatus]
MLPIHLLLWTFGRYHWCLRKRKMDCKNAVPSSPVAPPPLIQTTKDLDRKVLRETLSIFALGSFLRMLKSKKSNYNVIKQDGESE